MPVRIQVETDFKALDKLILDLDKGTMIKRAGDRMVNELKANVRNRSGRLRKTIKFEYGSPTSVLSMIWYGIPYFSKKRISAVEVIRRNIRQSIRDYFSGI